MFACPICLCRPFSSPLQTANMKLRFVLLALAAVAMAANPQLARREDDATTDMAEPTETDMDVESAEPTSTDVETEAAETGLAEAANDGASNDGFLGNAGNDGASNDALGM